MSSETTNVAFRETLNNAIRYWEPRRVLYNGALLAVVVAAFIAGWPVSKRTVEPVSILLFFIFTVLANVVYCAAYLPDLALQNSSFRDAWLRFRWVLLVVGTLMACAITYLTVAGPLGLWEGDW